jgi:predicted GIY-YIG superfamily endonuclease
MSGIYNKAGYIGSTTDVERREKEHLCALQADTHYNSNFQISYNIFGRDNLKMIVLEAINNEADRSTKERNGL